MDAVSESQVAQILKALAHPHRIRIVQALEKREHCVHELERRLQIKQSNLSQHLRILRDQGILDCQRRGMIVCYRIHNRRVLDVIKSSRNCLNEEENAP
jgi:ArsR family transcriptional regulator